MIGNCMALNNEKKKPIQNRLDRHEPPTTTELQAPDLGQAQKDGGEVKHVNDRSTPSP